jgi:hypothetical protein
MVTVPAQELGDLDLQGGLHQQLRTEPGDSSEISGSGRPAANSSSIWWRMRPVGDTRTGTGVSPSFEDLPVLKGTYARRSSTPDLGRHQSRGMGDPSTRSQALAAT